MSIPEEDPRPTPRCPECLSSERTSDATDRQIADDPARPYWCDRCCVPFKGSVHEFDQWQAAKAARAAERGQIASVNERGARAARPKETGR